MIPGLTNYQIRGGFGRGVLYDPATGDVADVRFGAAERADPEPGRVTLDDGTLDERARGRGLVVSAFGEREARQIEAWATAGTAVCAVALARGRGRHRLWREPVPCLSTERAAPVASLGGVDVLLRTALYTPTVYDDSNLLAGLVFGPGGDWTAEGTGTVTWGTDGDGAVTATLDDLGGTDPVSLYTEVVLPAPGLPVAFAADVSADTSGALSISPRGFDNLLRGPGITEPASGDGPTDVVHTLPEATYRVRVVLSGAATYRLPTLLTRKVTGSRIPHEQASGLLGFRYRSNGDGTGTLSAYAPGAITDDGGGRHTLDGPSRAFSPVRPDGWTRLLSTDD